MAKQHIINVISSGKIEEAIALLEDLYLNDDAKNELTLLKSRFSTINKNYYVSRIINDDTFFIETNKLIKGLVEFVNNNINDDSADIDTEDDLLLGNNEIKQHVLHSFPRGPRVPFDKVSSELYTIYAELFSHQMAEQVVLNAISLRKQADEDDKVTTVKLIDLPPHDTTPPIDYWRKVFSLSCLHGPRMLGALLYVVPEDQFPRSTKKARQELLDFLKSMSTY